MEWEYNTCVLGGRILLHRTCDAAARDEKGLIYQKINRALNAWCVLAKAK